MIEGASGWHRLKSSALRRLTRPVGGSDCGITRLLVFDLCLGSRRINKIRLYRPVRNDITLPGDNYTSPLVVVVVVDS